MSRTLALAVGAVVLLAGVVFTLQGLDILTGAGMSGKTLWVVLGPLIALGGLVLMVRGLRTRPVDDL